MRSWGYDDEDENDDDDDDDHDYGDYGDDEEEGEEGINIISSHSGSLHFHFPAMGAMIKTSQKSFPE